MLTVDTYPLIAVAAGAMFLLATLIRVWRECTRRQ